MQNQRHFTLEFSSQLFSTHGNANKNVKKRKIPFSLIPFHYDVLFKFSKNTKAKTNQIIWLLLINIERNVFQKVKPSQLYIWVLFEIIVSIIFPNLIVFPLSKGSRNYVIKKLRIKIKNLQIQNHLVWLLSNYLHRSHYANTLNCFSSNSRIQFVQYFH